MRVLRIYVDASVIGGCFDPEFASESQALIKMAEEGRVRLIISDLLVRELQDAPEAVRELFTSLPAHVLDAFTLNEEAYFLSRAYLEAGVVGPVSEDDAQHVANATVAHADMLVSWNLRHIVHFDKIRGYNAVNLREGYALLSIHTPKEVV